MFEFVTVDKIMFEFIK